MAYLGLARKWRPQTFADLIGQQHIAQTISNAIKLQRVGHGYLFTGTRGVGKTSAARIFSKALRCSAPPEPGTSCNQCEDCIQVAEGKSVNVLEIDGASNNGVDAIREIRENARYLPTHGKYKIYIVDEVHMLTTAAFNALLKTLEEPPSHVIFVFATTDPQKIPATVLSRCQRFDFKRASEKDLKDRLQFICSQEMVEIEDGALTLLAREAEGSIRDGISLLDQILSCSEEQITLNSVYSALGLIDRKVIVDCATAILKKQPTEALENLGKVYLHGYDLKLFGRELLRILRHAMVVQLLSKNPAFEVSNYLDLSDTEIREVKELASLRPLEELDLVFRILSHGIEEVGRSQTPKILFDVLLIKISSATNLVMVENFRPIAAATTSPNPAPAITSASTPVSTQGASAQTPTNLFEWWKNSVTQIKSKKPLLGSILEHMSLESITNSGGISTLTLGYSKDHAFYKEQLSSKAYQDLLNPLIKNFLGNAVRFEYKEVSQGQSPASLEKQKHDTRAALQKKAVLEIEALQATENLLGAKLEKLDISLGGMNL